MKKLRLFIVFCVFSLTAVFAEEAGIKERLSKIIGAEAAGGLVSKGSLLTYKYKSADMSPALVPDLPLMRKIGALKRKTDKKPAFLIENLYLYKKETDTKIDCSKILRSVSKLEGLQYYSHSRQAMRTFLQKIVRSQRNGKGRFRKNRRPDRRTGRRSDGFGSAGRPNFRKLSVRIRLFSGRKRYRAYLRQHRNPEIFRF